MRLLDFFDGFTSGTEPLNGIVSADSLKTFASDAAYVTAKGSVATDGDCYYNTVSDQIKVYSNGAWISIDNPPIDLASSEVTGTLPLNKGGTNATTKSAAFDSLSPMTTSGDVIYGGASGTGTRLAKGTDGQVLTLASGLPSWAAVSATVQTSSFGVLNLGLSASIGSSLLSIALKQSDGSTDPSSGAAAVRVGFRSSTLSSGSFVERSVTGSLSISSVAVGASFGNKSGVDQDIFVYLIDNAGTVEIALSGYGDFDEGVLHSTTAVGAGSNSASVLYSTTSRSNVAIRKVGRIKSNQATAGTYASAIAEVSVLPLVPVSNYSAVHVDTGNGHGSTNTRIRRFTTARVNIGSAITYADSAGNGGSFTINKDGIYVISYVDAHSGAGREQYGVSVNSSALTTNFVSLSYATGKRLIGSYPGSADPGLVTGTLFLQAGDVVRAHTNANPDATADCQFLITKVS